MPIKSPEIVVSQSLVGTECSTMTDGDRRHAQKDRQLIGPTVFIPMDWKYSSSGKFQALEDSRNAGSPASSTVQDRNIMRYACTNSHIEY